LFFFFDFLSLSPFCTVYSILLFICHDIFFDKLASTLCTYLSLSLLITSLCASYLSQHIRFTYNLKTI
ncbi:hypothetical protein BJ165DRAFT_1453003, partial [Panaeolus papilionaceus]